MSISVEEEFRRRLRLIMQQFGSVADLARAVGVSDNAIYKWVSGRGQPGMASLVNLAKAAGVSVEWLATGHGAATLARLDDLPPRAPHLLAMPLAAMPTSPFGGSFKSPQLVDFLGFRPDWLQRTFGVEPDALALIEVHGDSMAPTIDDGDLILAGRHQAVFLDDGLYVLVSGGQLMPKRLQRQLDGSILVRSDNPAYESFRAAPDQLQLFGRVLWLSGKP
jgi:phage repressor protein C with HTH and peptisase S24 domain